MLRLVHFVCVSKLLLLLPTLIVSTKRCHHSVSHSNALSIVKLMAASSTRVERFMFLNENRLQRRRIEHRLDRRAERGANHSDRPPNSLNGWLHCQASSSRPLGVYSTCCPRIDPPCSPCAEMSLLNLPHCLRLGLRCAQRCAQDVENPEATSNDLPVAMETGVIQQVVHMQQVHRFENNTFWTAA